MTTVDTYRYYTDSKGTLLSGDEWEKLNKGIELVDEPLPEGWPKQLEGPLVWDGIDLEQNQESFLYYLTDDDKRELHDAIINYYLPLDQISNETFPLPNLSKRLEEFSRLIYFGNGVRVIRGFEIDNYDRRQQIIGYLGISSYIGDIRDAQGLSRALTHIKSIAHIPKDKRAQITVSQQTTDPQMFHNDFGGDIVSLFVLGIPLSGGESLVTSGYSIYNELAKTRPDFINTLAATPGFLRSSKLSNGVPLIHYVDGRLFTAFSTRGFIGYGETAKDEVHPELTREQQNALGAYHWVGYKHGIVHKLVKGDIEYVNNLFLQHSRLGYSEDEGNRRHVARLWLRNSKYTSQIKKPTVIEERTQRLFPVKYKQLIPLTELEEDEIKLANNADTLEKIYARPE